MHKSEDPAGGLPAAATETHPLEPLSAGEIDDAVRTLREHAEWGPTMRFVSVELREPPKDSVLAFEAGAVITVEREAAVILLDRREGETYEAVVSLSQGLVRSLERIAGMQAALTQEEHLECEALVKADPAWQEALRKRGVENFDHTMIDSLPAGYVGAADEEGKRVTRALTWVRDITRGEEAFGGYGRPVEGVVVLVDLTRMEVIKVEDFGVTPLPPAANNVTEELVGPPREDLKPLEISQPEGPSFEIRGHHIAWQKWSIRFGFTPREGLVLHTVSYRDKGRDRRILYRASLSEMLVPYGDPSPTHNRKSVFDVGEDGLGLLANSLELRCDCLGEIRYFDAAVVENNGSSRVIKNAVCLHEEDYGTLWKHTDWRTGHTEVRRSRRLVLSFFATDGNYDYGFFWYFYQDGTIALEAKLTGCVSTGALPPGERSAYAPLIAPQLSAPVHQHIFNVRLDMMVDGPGNSVYEVDSVSSPAGEDNPVGNAFRPVATLLSRESEAQRVLKPEAARVWKVANPSVRNIVGEPVAYRLVPGENVLPLARPDAHVIRRAGFATKHFWVTAYDSRERYAAGDYPNQHRGGGGLPAYAQADRPLENADIVLWYTFGHHHIPRPEDWPVMPMAYIGFALKPSGFFDSNPAMDVPRPSPAHCHRAGGHHAPAGTDR